MTMRRLLHEDRREAEMTEMNSKEQMTALVLHGVGDLRLEKVDIPQPGPGQVQIAVKKVRMGSPPAVTQAMVWSRLRADYRQLVFQLCSKRVL